jgi:hypothetical protein
MPCPKDIRHNLSKLSHGAMSHRCEAKSRVDSDWLISSSKLQPCLELWWFARRLLRQKLQDGKRISLSESTKRPMCNIRQNGWRITQGTQPERRMWNLESHSYNKSHPSAKAYCFSKTDEVKPFLVVSDPCLTFISTACVSFTLAQVCSLISIYHHVKSLWIRKCFPITIPLL